MTDMTPDELRKLPDRYPDGPSHATMDAFADAWEAQQQEWSKHYKTDTDTILDLRKRLEAADAMIQKLKARLHGEDTT